MSRGRPRAMFTKKGELTEAVWQSRVIGLAEFYGWRHYHTHNSERSVAGFPDLVLVRGVELVFAELKGPSTKITKAQLQWLADLVVVGDAIEAYLHLCDISQGDGVELADHPRPAVEAHVWRAPDLNPVHERLARGRHRQEAIA